MRVHVTSRATSGVTAVVLTLTAGAVAATAIDDRAAAPGQASDSWGPPVDTVVADGPITDMLRMGDRVYVRGGFDAIGTFSGSGMPIDAATGTPVDAPVVDGQVSVTLPDGAGGWYVAGDFQHVGDTRLHGLAHLDSAGVADPGFAPRVDGLVDALALHDGTLWIGGSFGKVDGTTRSRLAAVDADTGALLPFDAPQDIWVRELAYAEGHGNRPARLYVGSNRLVALDPVSGAPDLTFAPEATGAVRALLAAGDTVYVGGQGLSALDADTGERRPDFGLPAEQWGGNHGTVHTLLLAGDQLYAGGDFPTLGGGNDPGLVSLDPENGLAHPTFDARVRRPVHRAEDAGVFDLALVGQTLWAGGSFARAAGAPSGNLVAVDAATGERRTDVATPSYERQVNAVDLSGDRLYVGGHFYMVDAVASEGFAALDADTLQPVAEFQPGWGGYGELLAGRGSVWVAPAHFDGFDPSPAARETKEFYFPTRDTLQAFDPMTGERRERLRLGARNLSGVALHGDELFVVERLDNRVRFPGNRVSVYSQRTGRLLRTFELPLPGYVNELTHAGGRLVAAGSFRRWRANGQPAHLAVISMSPRTGRLDQELDPHVNGPVDDVEATADGLLVAGLFGRVHTGTRSVGRPGLASFSREGTFLSLRHRFDPPGYLADRRIGEVVDLGPAVLVSTYPAIFLDTDTAQRLVGMTDGYRTEVDAVVGDGDRIVYSATVSLRLAGHEHYYLSFVSRAAAG